MITSTAKLSLSILVVAGLAWWAHHSTGSHPAAVRNNSALATKLAANFPSTAKQNSKDIKKDTPKLPPAPSREDLAGTSLELSLSEDGDYQIAPKGGYRFHQDVLVAATPEVWQGQEQNLLKEINGDLPKVTESDEAVIAAWRKSISSR